MISIYMEFALSFDHAEALIRVHQIAFPSTLSCAQLIPLGLFTSHDDVNDPHLLGQCGEGLYSVGSGGGTKIHIFRNYCSELDVLRIN